MADTENSIMLDKTGDGLRVRQDDANFRVFESVEVTHDGRIRLTFNPIGLALLQQQSSDTSCH